MVGIMAAKAYSNNSKTSLIEYVKEALKQDEERKEQLCIDLFIPSSLRLTETERNRAILLLERLVMATENEIRLRLTPLIEDFAPISLILLLNDPTNQLSLNCIFKSALLRDQHFAAVLIRRISESRLRNEFISHKKSDSSEKDIVDDLISQTTPDIALSAMALLIAESRRLDHLEDPVFARTDLPAELQYRLLWWVAACLRSTLLDYRISENKADEVLALAVNQALSCYDEGDTLDSRAIKLARSLWDYRRLTDGFIVKAAFDGHIALMVAALAVRAGINQSCAWDMVLDGDGSPLLLLLRAIGMARHEAITLALQLTNHNLNDYQLTNRIDAFDTLTQPEADKALTLWRLDEYYRCAISDIGHSVSNMRKKNMDKCEETEFFEQDYLS
ncbi:hypothetical protein ZMO02_08260 [Zymomonas mobilis subsp. pomaceae]|uniref:DUF2336 domain-containing protein n=2 Tax=Zymomonas mobilis TaxID=542 RepID=F8ETY3_ZYMMT|nr:Protein of unknown function DUF2336 [Zymomonas mobilis subsp. pomaceae ATCC 29192]GEB89189.1 hypothetical protein ZMO02_08260 [Zymomonas mobilis subsp. pomaceae]